MCENKQSCCEQGRDPQSCSDEQIRECHGDAPEHPCETEGCQKGPGDCAPEQVRECHGDTAEHPCDQ